MHSQIWMIVPGNVALSALILFAIAMPFLYAARRPVHEFVRAVAHLVHGPLRLVSRSLFEAAQRMRYRNHEVLLAHGREEMQSHIARDFERIAALVKRDLEGYPVLQQRLLAEVTRVEDDYKKCGEVPPPPPEWVEAVEAIGKVKNGNELVRRILDEINTAIKEINERMLKEYRNAYEERHKILNGYMPFWRSLQQTLVQADRRVTSLNERAVQIDAQMDKFEGIVNKTPEAEHALAVSAGTQLAITTIVLAIATGGALVNYKLIALPMSEMVGAGDYITATLRSSDVAALVIIFVEATMGLFLMETLGITRLFPKIHSLSDRVRRRMMFAAATLLLTLAGIEAALALMRDMLIADKAALIQSLSTVQQHAADGWLAKIPTAGQMLLGFILPFALAFVAVPLESFIASARTVLGALLVWLTQGAGVGLRLLATLVKNLARVVTTLYDILIVLPLLVERFVKRWRKGAGAFAVEDETLAPRRP